MEKLYKRSDGISETSSGLFGVSPLRYSEHADGTRSFEFMGRVNGPVQHVIWEGNIAVIKPDTALVMVAKGYASHLTDEQVQEWNEMVQEWIDSQFVPDPDGSEDTPDTPEVTEDNSLGPQNDTPGDTGGDMTTETTPTEETPPVETLTEETPTEETPTEETSTEETPTEETSTEETPPAELASEETSSEETSEETSTMTEESVVEEETPTPKKKRGK